MELQKKENNGRKPISIEEYLDRRQKKREEEKNTLQSTEKCCMIDRVT